MAATHSAEQLLAVATEVLKNPDETMAYSTTRGHVVHAYGQVHDNQRVTVFVHWSPAESAHSLEATRSAFIPPGLINE